MDQQGAVEFVLGLAQEHHQADVDLVLQRGENLTLRVFNGQVEKIDQATALGLGIRVVQEGRTGIAYTERLAPEAIERAFVAAQENAQLNDPTEVMLPSASGEIPDPQTLGLYNPELEVVTVAELETFGLEIEAAARAADARVTSVPALVVSRSNSEFRVVSTHGVTYYQRQNAIGASCQVLLEDQGSRKTGRYGWAQREWNPARSQEIGTLAVARGADLLHAAPIPGGQIPVVLDEYCAPQLLSIYFGCFSGDAAQKGQSRLKGRLGEVIADTSLSLVDDPHRVGASGSCYMDAEGTLTQPMSLITDGQFSNFLYHIESARRDGRESTGHAGRGYTGGISTTRHNTVMPTGDYTLDELMALPERCLLITQLEGAAGCQPLSGDISIGVQGFWVENGQRQQPVDSVTIAGNFFDVLKSIRARGNFYQPNLTSMYIPPLLIDGLVVSS
ncbi:TldD/PmbA family protein [Candidatus Entotheonella palauensis]|uniref:TldD/PmbA family protein n=1 Tax=Candidatus Entotheonella palauensis TaxID=93172 RepID=UPI000B7E45B6|nr:metallopeptidase TldD-related protein [Candidatus Entotheonella palauensis]